MREHGQGNYIVATRLHAAVPEKVRTRGKGEQGWNLFQRLNEEVFDERFR